MKELMHSAGMAFHCCFWALLTLRVFAAEPGNAPAWKAYETAISVTTYIPLTDGNSIRLNTRTKLRTLVTGDADLVSIDGGEAFFRVRSRSLEVAAGAVLVSGTQTSFSVRVYEDGAVEIVPLQGFVVVHPERGEHGSSASNVIRADRLVYPGQIAAVRSGRVVLRNLGRPAAERRLMWRFGMLEFVNERVEDIAAEFNRYSPIKLIIDDPVIRCARIGGRFSLSDMEVFIDTLSRIYEIHTDARQTPSGLVVSLGRPRKTIGSIQCGKQSNSSPQG